MKKILLTFLLLALVLTITNCGDNALTDTDEVSNAVITAKIDSATQSQSRGIQRATSVDIGTIVKAGVIRLSRGSIVKYVTMTIAGDNASAVVTGILVGSWHADIQLYDENDLVVYSGSSNFRINSGEANNSIIVNLYRHSGSAIFDFTLPHETIDVDPGMTLWNKMGGLTEVQNSIIGPALVPGSACSFVGGKFGGAISNVRSGLRTTRARMPAGIMYYDNFAIEFWIKKNPNVIDGLGSMITMNENGQVLHIQQRAGYSGAYRTFIELESNGVNVLYYYEHNNLAGCNVFLPPSEWVHLAVSADSTRPAGSRIRLFKNGVEQPLMVANEGVLPHTILGSSPYLLASWAWDNDGFDGCMDNLKVYNYSKTRFISDFEY